MYTFIKKEQLKKVKGRNDVKIKYSIKDENGNVYCMLKWDQTPYIIYDYMYDEELSKINWYYNNKLGYVLGHNNGDTVYMHVMICELGGIMEKNKSTSVDHINTIKTDNRLSNLRMATQSEQNSNRPNRRDKIEPCNDLKNIGVTELPRYLRWDNTEHKFVIDRHPQLVKDVESGLRKKWAMSCTKRNISIVDKYHEALAKLKELDDMFYDDTYLQFQQRKAILYNTYYTMSHFIDSMQNL